MAIKKVKKAVLERKTSPAPLSNLGLQQRPREKAPRKSNAFLLCHLLDNSTHVAGVFEETTVSFHAVLADIQAF